MIIFVTGSARLGPFSSFYSRFFFFGGGGRGGGGFGLIKLTFYVVFMYFLFLAAFESYKAVEKNTNCREKNIVSFNFLLYLIFCFPEFPSQCSMRNR